ncbi:MAG: type IV pili methyl-accepting chemotaxis transducer N-terminal domain-containing protein [Deltaproteobacteria bacterium]|nr:type IV pili methyl-accepting chemotaxis transducer N-terminal domain-containing protein [Deltaproteobacteria bacterium]
MPARRLRVTYLVGLSLIAICLVLTQVSIQKTIEKHERDSRIVDQAGRQRMLSQKLAKLALIVLHAGGAGDAARAAREIEYVRRQWASSHEKLERRGAMPDLPEATERDIGALFAGIEPHFHVIERAAGRVAAIGAGGDPAAPGREELLRSTRVILSHEPAFLDGMDAIVLAYDEAANAKVRELQRTDLVLTAIVLLVIALVAIFVFERAAAMVGRQYAEIHAIAEEKTRLAAEMQAALDEVKQLSGLLPVCAWCRKVRDDKGYWTRIEAYVEKHSNAVFSHGMCPECLEKNYPQIAAKLAEPEDG